jgi:hypothetical protein
MPAKTSVKFTRPKEIKRAEFNEIVRECFTAAALLWIREFQMLHYMPGAAQRYQMPARTEKYKRRRAAYARARGEESTNLVWSGRARDLARMRQANPFLAKIKARATSNKQYVTVPIPIGHAIHPKMIGSDGTNDFGRLTRDEMQAMAREAKRSMTDQMNKRIKVKETTTIGALVAA